MKSRQPTHPHYCSKTRNGKFVVKRKTQAKRLVRKLKAIREDMLDRMHTPVREQHRWLRQVLRGQYQYYGVIFNYRALRMFKELSRSSGELLSIKHQWT